MALITSNCGPMRLPEHQMALITSRLCALQGPQGRSVRSRGCRQGCWRWGGLAAGRWRSGGTLHSERLTKTFRPSCAHMLGTAGADGGGSADL